MQNPASYFPLFQSNCDKRSPDQGGYPGPGQAINTNTSLCKANCSPCKPVAVDSRSVYHSKREVKKSGEESSMKTVMKLPSQS